MLNPCQVARCPSPALRDGRCLAHVRPFEAERRAVSAKGPAWEALRRLVIARDKGLCRDCGRIARPPHVDHVTPRRAGGSDDPSNLVTRCRRCHSRKTAIDVGFAPGVPPRKSLDNDRLQDGPPLQERSGDSRRFVTGGQA